MAKKKYSPRKDKFIVFDHKAYIAALSKELKMAVQDVRHLMYERVKFHLSEVAFRDTPVEMIDGRITTDRERAREVIQSLWEESITHLSGKLIRTTVSALKKGVFKDTHIGLYYEYGTGELTDGEATYESLGTPNAYFRPPNTQSRIVTRSKNYDYGYGKGVYIDAGGNMRKTNAPYPGRRSPSFVTYIGEDIAPTHWFRNAFEEVRKEFIEKYIAAIKFIHPGLYIRLSGGGGGTARKKGKFVLG